MVGFNGETISAQMENCYWVGAIEGSSVPRQVSSLIYSSQGPVTIKNSYYNKDTYPSQYFTGIGLTTTQMKQQSSYTGWDFNNTWYMESNGYPELKFE